ncbi:Ankyrin repeat-containing domain protein [Elaphomyces granulatus]|jgi:ankyrin repeat protein
MPLSDLPREILLLIVDHLDDAGSNALARTHSQIHELVNERLYFRDVTESPTSRSLTWATQNGLEATFQRAVDACRYSNPIPKSFHAVLQVAAEKGHVHLVKLLLKLDGIDPNYVGDPWRIAPLVLAAKRGHTAIVELLLAAHNIEPDIRGPGFSSPLLWACQMGHISVVRQLLAQGHVDINALSCSRTVTPLTVACFLGHEEIIELLLAQDGIDVNINNGELVEGKPPLMIAIDLGLVRAVESFIARDDLDPNIVDSKQGVHALAFAVQQKKVEIVRLLLQRPDINPNFVSTDGETAFTRAINTDSSSDRQAIIKALLDKEGIDVNLQDNFGRTPLCHAMDKDCFEAAKLLLERDDIDINIPDNDGQTALHYACNKNVEELVDLILKKDDINPNARDIPVGYTPLANACRNSSTNMAIVDSLLSHPDTDPNAVDNNGVNIFAHFMRNRHNEEIEVRLRAVVLRDES